MASDMTGHHLMRVRIRTTVFRRLQAIADEETIRTGENVTVSDLVRAACQNHLLLYDALRRLENAPPDEIDQEILIVNTPL